MQEYGGKPYRRQLFARLAGSVPTYTVNSYNQGYKPAEKPGKQQQTCSSKDFYMTEMGRNGLIPRKESLHKGYNRPCDLYSSFDHISSTSILLRLDSQGNNNPTVSSDFPAIKPSQRLRRGLSSRRETRLSPNHFLSTPVPRRTERSVCGLGVEVRPLTGNQGEIGGKQREGKLGKRERRRKERMLVEKTREILQLSPWCSLRLAL